MPAISVIIPCYNQGKFVLEAINSVLEQTFTDFEIIVVNDGSTDEYTNELLHSYTHEKVQIIHTENRGLSGARNTGIAQATGTYILPLDADDKIANTYLAQAHQVFTSSVGVRIVYCKAAFFGAQSGDWKLPAFSFPDILVRNCIFCSAFFRREDWETVGGYNRNMKFGYEDWDFWIALLQLGGTVTQLDDVLFFYRKHSAPSMLSTLGSNKEKKHATILQLIKNHADLYLEHPNELFLLLAKVYKQPRNKVKWYVNAVCCLVPNKKLRKSIRSKFLPSPTPHTNSV